MMTRRTSFCGGSIASRGFFRKSDCLAAEPQALGRRSAMHHWPLLAAFLLSTTDTLPNTLSLDVIPLGLAARPVPDDNPLTEARVRLGRKLFFDPILSGDRTVACASCHHPAHGFSSGAVQARGVGGKPTKRKAPSLLNRAYGTAF